MLTWQLILIQIVTFVLIVAVLRWLLYSQISQALKKLHQLNKQNLAKEKALKEELARAKKQAEGEISRAVKQAKAIVDKAKADSEEGAGKVLDNARNEAKKIIDGAKRESQRRANEIMVKMREKTAYLAADMVRYMLSQNSQKNFQGQLIEELIDEVRKIPSDKLKVENSSIEVISAFELDSQQKNKLKEVLSSQLGREVSLTSRVDPDIVAGMILRSGGFVIDGSLRNKLGKILPIVKDKAKKE